VQAVERAEADVLHAPFGVVRLARKVFQHALQVSYK
jgi:H2-forming N5,N10-methylenetetrahydromethanopterin dehydrogenase-like enzyme